MDEKIIAAVIAVAVWFALGGYLYSIDRRVGRLEKKNDER